MASTAKLKETFGVESKHGAFYTGGNIEWHEDTLFCQNKSNITLLNIDDSVLRTIGEDADDPDVIHTFTTNADKIVTFHKSGLLKLWNLQGEIEKTWKSIHKGPIARLVLKSSDKLASGGSDGCVRIWDLTHHACTLNLKGCEGVVNVVCFHPSENALLASGDDGKIHIWDLDSGNLLRSYSAHYSKVTSLVFTHDKNFVSVGRDKVIIYWNFESAETIKTIPTFESIESIVDLPQKFKLPGFKSDASTCYVASGGELGKIKVWDVSNAKLVYEQTNSIISKAADGNLAITSLLFNKKLKALAAVTWEQNIIVYHLKSFACLKQFTGFSDEILDIAFVGEQEDFLAVATNSSDIKLYDRSMSCQILKGHEDIVLALSTSKSNPNLMASSGKDKSVRLWRLNEGCMSCVAIGNRHTAAVGSIAISQTSASFIVSASQDTCIKLWDIPKIDDAKKIPADHVSLTCKFTEIAHEKDINCVAVSPNDKIIATASQDKMVKLWTDSLSLLGVLKGHKRGVWSVRFSPVDQVLITSSADCTIKLWSVVDLNCLKTFEGHEASVLRAEFVANGMQILSAGADGLLKLFTIKTSECVSTLDEHEGRIWAMAVNRSESHVVTGGSDSCLIKWRDLTEEKRQERLKEMEELVLQEQTLNNYIHSDQLLKALKLALKLNKPFQVLKIVQGVIKKGDSGLVDAIQQLKTEQKADLLKCAVTWNTNSKNCQPAQIVMNILINELQTGEFRPVGLASTIEGALPYTERHFNRLTQLMQDLHFIKYTVNCMQPHAKNFIDSEILG